MRQAPKCDYCHRDAKLVTGAAIYPRRPDLFAKFFWQCEPCEAHVGCHEGGKGYGDGTRPLGRLANANLRRLKSAAHAAFDPLWKSGRMGRHEAYGWLADKLGIAPQNCHIGMFNEAQCQAVVALVQARDFA